MKLPHLLCAASLIIAASVAHLAGAQEQPALATQQPAPAAPKSDISEAVGLSELKFEMALSRYKLSKNPKSINDLVRVLEEYLNTSCMDTLLKTLTYDGDPSDPTCISRMELLLEVNPTNPVGLCVRDGINAPSCVGAYQSQRVVAIQPGSRDPDIDPALKVGLPATSLSKIAKIEETLQNVDSKYRGTSDSVEKRALISDAANLYDQALAMACRLNSVVVRLSESKVETSEPTEIMQARERLIGIPPAIRRDYQEEMEKKALDEMNNSSTSEQRKQELRDLIKVIKDPSTLSVQQTSKLERSRVIPDKCLSLLEMAKRIVPDLPAVTCYFQGWQTPQCVAAVKNWRILKQKETEAAKRATPNAAGGTPSMISTF